MKRNKYVLSGPYLLYLLIIFLFSSTSTSLAQDVDVFTNVGLYGGQMYDIAIDPDNPDRMFVGSYSGDGLYRSANGGSSWEPVVTGYENSEGEFRNHNIYSIKMAPGNPSLMWVTNAWFVEKSIDGGQTWTHIMNGTMQKNCRNCLPCESDDGSDCENFRYNRTIAIDPDDHQTVYVGAAGPWTNSKSLEGAIFKTTDGGLSWEKTNGGKNFDYNVYEIKIDPQNSDILWAVTTPFDSLSDAGSLYRSEDAGNTWTMIYSMVDEGYAAAITAVAVKPDDSNVVFTGNGLGVIKHYFEDGQWKAELDIVPGSSQVEEILFDPQSPETVYATWGITGDGYVARSTDGGENWEIYEHGYDFLAMEVHPADPEIIFASDFNQGILKSVDHGQSWVPVNEGINGVVVYDVTVDPNDSTHILAGTISGVYERNGAGTWTLLLPKIAKAVQFHPTNSQVFFAGSQIELGKTIDGGQSWTFSNRIGEDITDIAIDPANTNIIFVTSMDGNVYKSENEGDTLYSVLNSSDDPEKSYSFNALAIDPSDSWHIFAGGGNYFAPKRLGRLWESTDGGDTWSATGLRDSDETEEGIVVNALLINPGNPKIMYAAAGYSAGTQNPIYKSIDGGITWTPSFNGIDVSNNWDSATDIKFHRQNSDIVYVSTDWNGIYVSIQAKQWLYLGKPQYTVYAIAPSSLYAGTHRGLLQLTGTGVIAGNVMDASGLAIDNATVFNDLGASSVSIDGSYIMVSPPGICSVTALADNHSNTTEVNVLVSGGDVAWVDISMESGVSDPSIISGQENITRSGTNGGKACFVATAVYGSSMSKQVEILRDFRDAYLLPNDIGKKLVSIYYNNGKPAADYLDSHPWLKLPVRILLYPLIGISWFMLSTSAYGKLFMGLCFITGCIVIFVHIKRGRRFEQ